MPLPAPNTAWPPAQLADILPAYRTYDAWYTGNTDTLTEVYQGTTGLFGKVRDFFWGTKPQAEAETKMHAPLAADVCRVNADLLFSDPVTATVEAETGEPDEKTQDRLDLITESLHGVLTGAAELSAALGGTYLRATWDTTVSDAAFITKVDADLAWPEFRWGRLTAVTFWRVLAVEGGTHWRHLERHELDSFGVGVIRHGLYEGTSDDLGRPREFTLRPETEWLTGQGLIDGNTISTQSPGLDVVYIRNLEQAKQWRKHPLGANLGRSDLEGLLSDLDAYDKAYTSLMHDLEDGRSRLIVAQSMLEDNGAGKGASFDTNQRLFTGINAPPGKADGASLPIEQVQFKIRVQEHLQIMENILLRIVRSAGYSPRSFGLMGDGDQQKTATEVTSEDILSSQTRKRKIRNWEPQLEAILEKALAVDAAILGGGGQALSVDVQFSESAKESLLDLATIVQTLRTAKAASTETLVRIANPSADEDWIKDELARIAEDDELAPLEEPSTFRPAGAEIIEESPTSEE